MAAGGVRDANEAVERLWSRREEKKIGSLQRRVKEEGSKKGARNVFVGMGVYVSFFHCSVTLCVCFVPVFPRVTVRVCCPCLYVFACLTVYLCACLSVVTLSVWVSACLFVRLSDSVHPAFC